jgi:hypothetical protein
LEETPAVQSESKSVGDAAPPQVRRLPLGNILSFVVGLVGVAALAATGWVYTETQRDVVRISTDIAQIRLSLELYGRQQPAAAAAATGDEELLDLSNRLAILEQSWRGAASGQTPATLPPLPGEGEPATDTAASGGDCLPPGTRFMVTAGDNYAVCGTTGSVQISSVDNGFLTLGDGTVIAQGGTIGLPGTQCMIGMLPSDGGAISGFAEIRIVC